LLPTNALARKDHTTGDHRQVDYRAAVQRQRADKIARIANRGAQNPAPEIEPQAGADQSDNKNRKGMVIPLRIRKPFIRRNVFQ
jgi:hypothetical protein